MRSLQFVFTIGVLMTPAAFCMAQADDGETKKTTSKMEHITVYGKEHTRPDSLHDVDHARYSGFHRSIEQDDFIYSFTSVPDLLNKEAGIQVRQSGGLGSFSNTSIRGATGKQINFYLDGMQLNSLQNGSFNIGLIPSNIIERIDIYPDITPIQLSNAALGGAINIKTLDESDQRHGQISLGYGSYDSKKVELSYLDQWQGWHFTAALGHIQSEQDYEFLSKNNTPLVPSDDVMEQLYNNAYESDNILLKVKKDQLQLMFQHAQADKELPTIDSQNNSPSNVSNLKSGLSNIQVQYQWDFASIESSHRLFLLNSRSTFRDLQGSIGVGRPKHVNNNEDQYGYTGIIQHDTQNHSLSASVNLAKHNFTLTDKRIGRDTAESDRQHFLVALQDEWFLWNGDLQINTTLRYLYNKDRFDILSTLTSDPASNEENSFSETTYQLGLIKTLNENFSLKSNISHQVRIPTLFEQFGNQGISEGNHELKPETSDNFDIGISLKRQELNTQLIYFYKRPEDIIVTVYNSRAIGKPKNISHSTIQGIEGELYWQPSPHFDTNLRLTLLDSENKSEADDRNGKQLPGLYHQVLFADISTYWGPTKTTLSVTIEDDLYYDPVNSEAVKPDRKELINLNFRYRLQQHTFDLLASNLTDQQYMDFNYMPTPGITVFLTWSYEY